MKKAAERLLFSMKEIPNGICEMHFVREIWLRHVKCLRAWVDGFISFHICRKANISRKYRKSSESPKKSRNIFSPPISLPFFLRHVILARKSDNRKLLI